MNDAGIYKILNKINGKFYIGLASDLYRRWSKHKRALNNNSHENMHLQRAWIKYGEENFEFLILERTLNLFDLEIMETRWINETKSYDQDIGYNICKGGNSHLGLKRSADSKERMRQAQLGKTRSFEHREAISLGNSRPEKWPCPEKSKCKCERCRAIKTQYVRERRWAEENNKSYKGRKFNKWPCPDGQKCSCDKCKFVKNETQRERRLDKLYGQ